MAARVHFHARSRRDQDTALRPTHPNGLMFVHRRRAPSGHPVDRAPLEDVWVVHERWVDIVTEVMVAAVADQAWGEDEFAEDRAVLSRVASAEGNDVVL